EVHVGHHGSGYKHCNTANVTKAGRRVHWNQHCSFELPQSDYDTEHIEFAALLYNRDSHASASPLAVYKQSNLYHFFRSLPPTSDVLEGTEHFNGILQLYAPNEVDMKLEHVLASVETKIHFHYVPNVKHVN